MSKKYFTYDPEAGFETFETEREARATAACNLSDWSERAIEDGWSDEAEKACWGSIKEKLVVEPTGKKIEFDGETVDEWDGKFKATGEQS